MKTETLDWQYFEKELRAFIKKRVPQNAVDDITGDVILRLVANRDKFMSADKPLAWMYKVTSNIIADYFRAHATEKANIKQGISDSEQEQPADESTATAIDELANCVKPLIRSLPEPCREALLMTEIEGMKQADAARKLKLSESGMKSRVQRGRQQLKAAILECCQINMNRKGSITGYEVRKSCC